MQGSKYAPTQTSQYSSADLNANFQGKEFTPTKGQATNLDFDISDDHLVDGGRLITVNADQGDKIDIQIVDKNGIMPDGQGGTVLPGTVLKQFITDWPIYPGNNIWDFAVNYPAKIFAGLTIRIVYKSTAQLLEPQTQVMVGYRLHKVLW